MVFQPLTDSRREFLARSLMDVVKLGVAAAFASGLFAALGLRLQLAAVAGLMTSFVVAWILFPPKGERGR